MLTSFYIVIVKVLWSLELISFWRSESRSLIESLSTSPFVGFSKKKEEGPVSVVLQIISEKVLEDKRGRICSNADLCIIFLLNINYEIDLST